jgi:hypothetical protein
LDLHCNVVAQPPLTSLSQTFEILADHQTISAKLLFDQVYI